MSNGDTGDTTRNGDESDFFSISRAGLTATQSALTQSGITRHVSAITMMIFSMLFFYLEARSNGRSWLFPALPFLSALAVGVVRLAVLE